MSNFAHLQMREIYSLFAKGHLGVFQTGWAFYPITYKGEKYVVELRYTGWHYATELDDLRVMARCFEYREEKKLFRGHKGDFIFEQDATVIAFDDHEEIDIRKTTTDDLKIYLQRIMKEVFQAWEDERQAQARKEKKVAEAEAWNGIIKT